MAIETFRASEMVKILPSEIINLIGETFETIPNSSLIYGIKEDFYENAFPRDRYTVYVKSADHEEVKLHFVIWHGSVADHFKLKHWSKKPIGYLREQSPIDMYIKLTDLKDYITGLISIEKQKFGTSDSIEVVNMQNTLIDLDRAINIVETDYLVGIIIKI